MKVKMIKKIAFSLTLLSLVCSCSVENNRISSKEAFNKMEKYTEIYDLLESLELSGNDASRKMELEKTVDLNGDTHWNHVFYFGEKYNTDFTRYLTDSIYYPIIFPSYRKSTSFLGIFYDDCIILNDYKSNHIPIERFHLHYGGDYESEVKLFYPTSCMELIYRAINKRYKEDYAPLITHDLCLRGDTFLFKYNGIDFIFSNYIFNNGDKEIIDIYFEYKSYVYRIEAIYNFNVDVNPSLYK